MNEMPTNLFQKSASGCYQEKIEALSKALLLEPNSSEILINISLAHLNLCNLVEAYHFACLAENNETNNVEIFSLIAEVYNKLGKYQRAIPVLEQAILLNKNDYKLFHSLGSALTLSGKIEEAIKAYQQAIILNPNAGLVYAALSKTRKASVEDNNIEQLQSLAIQDRNPKTAINIYHGLAKELDDLGRYTEAFKALTKGKNRLRSVCVHEPKQGAENIKGLKALYEKHALEIKSTSKGSAVAPIFVTGMPRTGTTVVERILTNHQDVVTVGESIQLSILLKKQCQRAYAGLIDAQVLAETWSSIDFEQLGHDYIEKIGFISNNNQRFVDKLPLNILMAGVILRALPHAKIVCLLRDPLDTIIGNYRQLFEQASGTYTHSLDLHALANYVHEFRQLVISLQKQFPERFMVVNYETLVSQPLIEAKKMLGFCQLTWDENCLAIHNNKAPIGTASAAQVQEPIHNKSIGHSRHYMFCLQEIKMALQAKEDAMEQSQSLPALYQQAQALFQQQKYHQAEKIVSSLIKDEPENVSYYHFMAQIKEIRGFYQEQINYLTQALVLTPNSSGFLIKIAFAHLNLGHFEDAYRYAGLTEQSDNNNAEICSLISKLYSKLGKYDKSAQVLEKAVLLNNSDAKLFYSLGGALTLCGKIKAAIEAYQESIRLNPDSALVYAALSKTRKASVEDNNIEKLQSLFVKDRNPWTAINVYHGLAKELDDLGRYGEAFTTLTKGKKRLRAVCAYNPYKGAENIKGLVTLYDKQAQEIRATSKGSTAAPIFVTGMPRTGTTIVERILTNHQDVVTVGERFQLSALLKQQCQRTYAGLIDAQVLDDLWSTIDFEKLGHDYIESVSYLSNNNQQFVDKLPLNILMTGVILRALPQARIVCLLRDPLDTIIGNYRQVFEQASGAYAHTLDLHALANFVYEFRQLVTSLQQQFPQRFIVVNYETLVDEPLVQAKRLFDFCQLTWNDNYLDIHKNKAPIGTASAAQVQEPIHKKSLGQSHNYMFCLQEIKKAFQAKEEVNS